MFPIKVPKDFRIIAHRGARAYTPENTLSSFEMASSLGAKEFETDCQLTLDNKIVLSHDDNLSRFGYPDINISSTCYNDLKNLDMGSWYSPAQFSKVKILLLEDLFKVFNKKVVYHLELKSDNPELVEILNNLILKYNLEDTIIITAFNIENLLNMQKINKNIRLGWLVQNLDKETVELAGLNNFYQLNPKAENTTIENVENALKKVKEIRAWGVAGSAEDVFSLVDLIIKNKCSGCTIPNPDFLFNI